MPKTRDAFALREIYGKISSAKLLGRNEDDKVFSGWLIPKTPAFRTVDVLELARITRARCLKMEKLIEKHVERLRRYQERALEWLIDDASDEEARRNAARAKEMRNAYTVILGKIPSYISYLDFWIDNTRESQINSLKSEFGARLKRARRRKGLTTAEVAERLGLSYNGYSQYERGVREPPLWTLQQLARILGASLDWLLVLKE